MPIALITGGSRGLGRSAALHLARAGHDVVITYRADADAATATVAELERAGRRAVAFQLDTGAIASFGGFAEQLRGWLGDARVDVLVNNAGGALAGSVAETTEEGFDGIFDVHVKGVFFLTQTLLPLLADGGAIVNVTTAMTRVTFPGSAAYTSAKGAVEVLSRQLAVELGPRRIRVNSLAPGGIGTDFGGGFIREDEALREQIAGFTALGRVGEPDDVGEAVAALVASRWVNGQRVEVSGGMRL